jgi:hypothetical protein
MKPSTKTAGKKDADKVARQKRKDTLARLKERGHDLVHLSHHSGSCPQCALFEGKTFSISGKDREFPPLDDAIAGGMFHTGCQHVISMAPEERDRFIGKLQGKEGEAVRQA